MIKYLFLVVVLMGACTPKAATDGALSSVDEATRLRAEATVQKLYGPLVGGVEVVAVTAQSGVLKVDFRQHGQAEAKPLTVWLTADAKLAFAAAWDVTQRVQQVQADQTFIQCARGKGARVYGDPRHPGTVRQLEEFGALGRDVLVDCATTPTACATLGQTPLPITEVAGQRIAALVPRAQLGKLLGCP